MIDKKAAFTLAEVLITLGIIGIVAEMVIPTLIQDSQKAGYVAGLKKNYSVLTQAVSKYELDNNCVGDLSACSDFNGTDTATKWNALKSYFNLTQDCGTNNGCLASGGYSALNHSIAAITDYSTDSSWAKGVLSDGTILGLSSQPCASSVDYCAIFVLDVNGLKKPNKIGRDFFYLWAYANKIIGSGLGTASSCSPTGLGRNGQGNMCSSYVLFKGVMDY